MLHSFLINFLSRWWRSSWMQTIYLTRISPSLCLLWLRDTWVNIYPSDYFLQHTVCMLSMHSASYSIQPKLVFTSPRLSKIVACNCNLLNYVVCWSHTVSAHVSVPLIIVLCSRSICWFQCHYCSLWTVVAFIASGKLTADVTTALRSKWIHSYVCPYARKVTSFISVPVLAVSYGRDWSISGPILEAVIMFLT
jgi:hypothetical protein